MAFLKRTKYIKNMDKLLLIVTIIMSVYGLFNIVTASSREAVTNMDKSLFYYFYRHLTILIIGFIASFIVIRIDLKKYSKILPLIYIVTFCLNVWLVMKGNSTRGANNWINLGFFNLQPSEISKIVVIVCLAFLFEKFHKILKNDEKHTEQIWTIIIVGILMPFIVFLQKDLGTAIVLITIFLTLYLTSPIKKQEKMNSLAILIIIAAVGGLIIFSVKGYLLSDAQKSRFDFFDPCSKYAETGYQVCNAYIAINNGGALGLGIGKSTQKYSYIPEPHTDMVFAIISEELGLLRCTLIFIGYIIILYRVLKLSKITHNIRNRYICLGVAVFIFMHILINLGGLFGLIPLTGVPLPFLSYGGSFTLTLLISLAIVQRIHIETNLKIEKERLK